MFWKYAVNKINVKAMVPDLYLADEDSPNDMTSNNQEKEEKNCLTSLPVSLLSRLKGFGSWQINQILNIN